MSRDSHCEQNDLIQCALWTAWIKIGIMTEENVISTNVHIFDFKLMSTIWWNPVEEYCIRKAPV